MPSIHLISGDETLLVQEARQALFNQANKTGFDQRHILQMASGFQWDDFLAHTQSLGLFSEKNIIDLRNPQAKFDKQAQEILSEYAQDPNPDIFLVITMPKLSNAQKKTKWFKLMESHSKLQVIWPIQKQDLPNWIRQRLQSYKLNATNDAIKLLIELTEGHLLATDQAIQKLSLLYPDKLVSDEMVSHVMSDTAHFNVFDLTNYALAGKQERVIRIMDKLRAESTEPTLISWALARDVRLLYHLKYELDNGRSTTALLAKEWRTRQALLQQASRRLSLPTIKNLLINMQQADHMIKGLKQGDPWQILTLVATQLAENKS